MNPLDELNTCYPAKVVSFNPETQTAQCKISIEDYFQGQGQSFTKQTAPLLVDVPVYTPQGSGWSITFPIKEGDDCLILYAQKGYDQWLYSGAEETGLIDGQPTPEHYRWFDLSDSICLVGLRPIPRAISDYSPDDVDIRNKDKTQRITLKANGDIEIETTTNVSIKADTVNVNSTNANVIADNVKVEAKDTKVNSPKVAVDCPNTQFTGNITVAGVVNCGGIAMGGSARSAGVCDIKGTVNIQGNTSMTGTLNVSGEVSGNGKALSAHTHTGNMGSPTSPPN